MSATSGDQPPSAPSRAARVHFANLLHGLMQQGVETARSLSLARTQPTHLMPCLTRYATGLVAEPATQRELFSGRNSDGMRDIEIPSKNKSILEGDVHAPSGSVAPNESTRYVFKRDPTLVHPFDIRAYSFNMQHYIRLTLSFMAFFASLRSSNS